MSQSIPVVTYPDITFYDNLDSTQTGRSPTKGSGTWTTTDNFVLGSPLSSSGTASNACNAQDAFSYTRFAQSGNLDYSTGRIGFYFSWNTANFDNVAMGWIASPDTGSKFRLRKSVSPNIWDFEYANVQVSTSLISGTTNYVEVAWDINAAHGYCAEMRVNGGDYITTSGCSGGAPSFSLIGLLGDASGNNGESFLGKIDEVIVSSQSERDLYAIRDFGNFPN